jgi:REP element-mobilizing transposase RayT
MTSAQPHQRSLRNGRYIEAGLFYFLTSVTKDRSPFFLKSHAALTVLDALKWLDQKDRILLVVAVVMPDHLHFIAQLRDKTLSRLMHSLKSYTANEINKILGRRGNVWERQYYESGIRCEQALKEKSEYCLKNPERRGLVEDFREYPYWYCRYEV